VNKNVTDGRAVMFKSVNLNADTCCWIELQNVEECDATDDYSSNDADNPKK